MATIQENIVRGLVRAQHDQGDLPPAVDGLVKLFRLEDEIQGVKDTLDSELSDMRAGIEEYGANKLAVYVGKQEKLIHTDENNRHHGWGNEYSLRVFATLPVEDSLSEVIAALAKADTVFPDGFDVPSVSAEAHWQLALAKKETYVDRKRVRITPDTELVLAVDKKDGKQRLHVALHPLFDERNSTEYLAYRKNEMHINYQAEMTQTTVETAMEAILEDVDYQKVQSRSIWSGYSLSPISEAERADFFAVNGYEVRSKKEDIDALAEQYEFVAGENNQEVIAVLVREDIGKKKDADNDHAVIITKNRYDNYEAIVCESKDLTRKRTIEFVIAMAEPVASVVKKMIDEAKPNTPVELSFGALVTAALTAHANESYKGLSKVARNATWMQQALVVLGPMIARAIARPMKPDAGMKSMKHMLSEWASAVENERSVIVTPMAEIHFGLKEAWEIRMDPGNFPYPLVSFRRF